ncbi:uncharacterized protein LOC143242030 [Tachypleus tridentatus]|uniref:uncharacterized protein LOC143242030 n=1 Tax=Tachypleus tridentatus TaxID=6853 RepID=UPI003FD34599
MQQRVGKVMSNNPKKCRARFGLDQQNHWCKPCRRKKKCIRYLDGADFEESEENLGSVSSMEAPTLIQNVQLKVTKMVLTPLLDSVLQSLEISVLNLSSVKIVW